MNFLSHGWERRISGKELTIKSEFPDMVEYGDSVLADRRFFIKEVLATRGTVLYRPSFTKGKKQLPAREVDESRNLANVQIHIERVIGRLNKFKISSSITPISQVDLLDVMIVISGLVNWNESFVSN